MSQIFGDTGSSPALDIETITGNLGGAIGPDGAFNINLLGSGNILVTGDPVTFTLTISEVNTSVVTLTGDAGGAVSADGAGNIDVLGSGNILVTGNPGTNTLTISEVSTSTVTLTGDSGGAVSPDGAGNIDILAALSDTFNVLDIQSVGDPGTNTITITQFNTLTGLVSVVGGATGNIINFPLGGTDASFIMDISLVATNTANLVSAGYNIFGTIRSVAGVATLVGTPDKIVNEDALMTTGDANMVASGNNFQLQYTAPVGLNVDLTAKVKYTRQDFL